MRLSNIKDEMVRDLGENRYRSALRTCLWYAYGYHLALGSEPSSAEDYLADVRQNVLEEGRNKGEASRRVSTTQEVGPGVGSAFAKDLAVADGRHRLAVRLMFDRCQKHGVTSVAKLQKFMAKQAQS